MQISHGITQSKDLEEKALQREAGKYLQSQSSWKSSQHLLGMTGTGDPLPPWSRELPGSPGGVTSQPPLQKVSAHPKEPPSREIPDWQESTASSEGLSCTYLCRRSVTGKLIPEMRIFFFWDITKFSISSRSIILLLSKLWLLYHCQLPICFHFSLKNLDRLCVCWYPCL